MRVLLPFVVLFVLSGCRGESIGPWLAGELPAARHVPSGSKLICPNGDRVDIDTDVVVLDLNLWSWHVGAMSRLKAERDALRELLNAIREYEQERGARKTRF